MRTVVDTGVLVSGLIRRDSVPEEIINSLREKRFILIYAFDKIRQRRVG